MIYKFHKIQIKGDGKAISKFWAIICILECKLGEGDNFDDHSKYWIIPINFTPNMRVSVILAMPLDFYYSQCL